MCFCDVISCDMADNIIVKSEYEHFKVGSSVRLSPGQNAMFVSDGKVMGILTEETRRLDADVLPFIKPMITANGSTKSNCVNGELYYVRSAHVEEYRWSDVFGGFSRKNTGNETMRLNLTAEFVCRIKNAPAVLKWFSAGDGFLTSSRFRAVLMRDYIEIWMQRCFDMVRYDTDMTAEDVLNNLSSIADAVRARINDEIIKVGVEIAALSFDAAAYGRNPVGEEGEASAASEYLAAEALIACANGIRVPYSWLNNKISIWLYGVFSGQVVRTESKWSGLRDMSGIADQSAEGERERKLISDEKNWHDSWKKQRIAGEERENRQKAEAQSESTSLYLVVNLPRACSDEVIGEIANMTDLLVNFCGPCAKCYCTVCSTEKSRAVDATRKLSVRTKVLCSTNATITNALKIINENINHHAENICVVCTDGVFNNPKDVRDSAAKLGEKSKVIFIHFGETPRYNVTRLLPHGGEYARLGDRKKLSVLLRYKE